MLEGGRTRGVVESFIRQVRDLWFLGGLLVLVLLGIVRLNIHINAIAAHYHVDDDGQETSAPRVPFDALGSIDDDDGEQLAQE